MQIKDLEKKIQILKNRFGSGSKLTLLCDVRGYGLEIPTGRLRDNAIEVLEDQGFIIDTDTDDKKIRVFIGGIN